MADTVPGDNTSTVGLTVNGAPVNGTIDVVNPAADPDQDWYRVNLTAGQTYVFYTNATTSGDVGDTLLLLRD